MIERAAAVLGLNAKVLAALVLMFTAPAELLPILTLPVLDPVLMLVLKFDEAFKDTAAPVTVNPALPVINPVDVNAPPAVKSPVPVVIALLVVVSIPRVPVPVISMIVEFPASVTPVPLTVRFPPKEVRLFPDTVKVLSSVVAPWSVRAPGVVVDPMVLIDDEPEPNVLVFDAPVPRVAAPTLDTAPPLDTVKFVELIKFVANVPWKFKPLVIAPLVCLICIPLVSVPAPVCSTRIALVLVPDALALLT